MKPFALILLILLTLAGCMPKEEVSPLKEKVTTKEIMGYAFDLPEDWEEMENSARGKVGEVEIVPVKSYATDEILLTLSFLEIPRDSKESFNGYLNDLKEFFKDKDLHTSSSETESLDTYVLRIIDGELLILKVVFYEEFRGYLQFDFIFQLTAVERLTPVVLDIVNSVR